MTDNSPQRGESVPGVDERSRGLVVAHLAGDPEAFPEIARTFYPALFGHAYRHLRDQRAAEDAVQEALLRAYRALPRFNGDYRLGSWLHRILTHVCLDEGNRRQREADANRRWYARPEPTVDIEESAERAEATRRVVDALSRLPSNYREVLVLRDLMEMDYADVASRAGISEENARARVHRARAAMRRLVSVSTGVAIAFAAFVRRTGRASADIVHQTGPTLATMPPDAVASPFRAGLVVTSVATAAMAAAAVIPGGAPATPFPSVKGSSGAHGQRSAAGGGIQVATAAAAPSDDSSTSTSSSTTSSTTSTTIHGAGIGALVTTTTAKTGAPTTTSTTPPTTVPTPSIVFGSGQVTADHVDVQGSQPYTFAGPATLTMGGTTVNGTVSGTANLPGRMTMEFLGTTAKGQDVRLDVTANSTPGTAPTPDRQVYDFSGTITDSSSPPMTGASPSPVNGTFSMAAGGAASVSVEFTPPKN
jgi:RNA polymerase sigma-70 factor (ECF subfamily)